MKLIKYLYISCISLILAGCAAEELPQKTPTRDGFAYVEGDKVIVNVTVDAPEMSDIQTRALNAAPDYSDMHLYLVEFVDNGNPLQNTYITTYEPESEQPQAGKVTYKVVLNSTSKSRILHLIALPKDQTLGLDNIGTGIEASVIPNLKTTNNIPAYWRRLEFPAGYAKEENGQIVAADELEQLENVALVRNFSRVTITNAAANFQLKGFAIVNNPLSGSVAPWNSTTYTFPELLNANDQQIGYSALAATYGGFAAPGLNLGNQEAGSLSVEEGVTTQYLYERPFNSIRHTYLLVKGRRTGDTADSYYKLDIGKNDSDGIFRYYGLLRNFSFNITINSVEQKGYPDIQQALDGVVYNNFSFDINLSSMLNISDGDEIVFVNFTTAVLTDSDPQELEFKYRYKKGNQYINEPTFNGGNVSFIGLNPGNVIERVEYGTTNDADGWRTVKLYCYGAQPETKTQSFTIVKPTGLGRTINLILHRKWTFDNVKEFPGVLENWNATTKDEGEVGDAVGSDFTIFFDIPDNLEEAMFPLVFTLEADRQNMENNPIGALVVTSGPSGFSGVTGNRIKYQKSVTWTQYNDPLLSDPADNGTAIDNGNGTFTHRVRCRFRTTTDLTNLPFDESTTRVLITNDNFNSVTVTYHREQ